MSSFIFPPVSKSANNFLLCIINQLALAWSREGCTYHVRDMPLSFIIYEPQKNHEIVFVSECWHKKILQINIIIILLNYN